MATVLVFGQHQQSASKPTSSLQLPKPQLVRGPYLQNAAPTSMVIRWRTNALARSCVRIGERPQKLETIVIDSILKTEHIVRVSGLRPGTKYYYSIGGVKDTLQWGAENYFYTLPPVGTKGKYRIGVFGDCGTNGVEQFKVRDALTKYLGDNYMNCWLLLGDNAYKKGEDAEYQQNFFDVYQQDYLAKYPLFPSPGNHDYHDAEFSIAYAQKSHEIAYFHNFSMPVDGESGGVPSNNKAFYSFDLGNIHFLSLDSYGKDEGLFRMSDTLGPQVQWMKKDLEANQNKEWIVAYWHHPPYTMGNHNSDKEKELIAIRENFLPILERYNVDLVLCGHSHVYERSKLMKGYYGDEVSFNPAVHNLSQSTGTYDGSNNSCPYIKEPGKNQGTVYVVSGSAGQAGRFQASFPHDAMVYSEGILTGACMLEINGNRLDLKWITENGAILDQFTMMKEVNPFKKIKVKKGSELILTAPFESDQYNWNPGGQKSREISVTPRGGKMLYTVSDEKGCVKTQYIIETY
jgi:3',5'-cyclic AMP phosphodiesterase CpdA